MKIPFSFRDFDQHFFHLVDALSGCWHRHGVSPVVYQNGFAQLLGYRDLQDLMDNRMESVASTIDASWKAPKVVEAIVWNAFTSGLMGYNEAEVAVNLLPLERLDWKACIDAHKKTSHSVSGFFAVFDEVGAYWAGTPWLEQTPELIEAGAPPYSLCIAADGRGFRWSRLRDAVKKLPSNFDEKLSAVKVYSGLDSKQRRLRFYRDEMIEPLYEIAIDTITQQMLMPDGFIIVRCAGRDYLCNEHLNGYIPIAFYPNSGMLEQAVLMILRGEAVAFESSRLKPADDEGFQYEIYTPTEYGIRSLTRVHQALHFNSSIESLRQTRRGNTFTQANQVYLRRQSWLTPGEIPEGLADNCKASTLADLCGSQEVLPEAYTAFLEDLQKEIALTHHRASERVLEAYRDGELLRILNVEALFSVADLNRYALKKFSAAHPVADMDEDDKWYLIDQTQAQTHYEDVGRQILEAFPGLSNCTAMTLGWLHYSSYDDDFTEGYKVKAFRADNDRICAYYLCYLIMVIGALTESVDYCLTHRRSTDGDEYCAVATLIEAITKSKRNVPLTQAETLALESMNPYLQFKQLRKFRSTLEFHEKNVQKVLDWQERDAKLWAIRAAGEYLYATDKVPTERQPSFGEAMIQEGRKYGTRTVTVTQSLTDFAAGDDGSSAMAELGAAVLGDIRNALQTDQNVKSQGSTHRSGRAILSCVDQGAGATRTP
jgi:hypothetical protein